MSVDRLEVKVGIKEKHGSTKWLDKIRKRSRRRIGHVRFQPMRRKGEKRERLLVQEENRPL